MVYFLLSFISLSALLTAYAFVSVVFLGGWRHVYTVMGCGVIIAALFFGYSDMLGRPKPAQLTSGKGEILHTYMVYQQAIYIWYLPDGTLEPKYIVLPWSDKVAKALTEAEEQSKGGLGGGRLGIDIPWERSWEMREPMFHPFPQPKLPDKNGEEAPKEYRSPQQGT